MKRRNMDRWNKEPFIAMGWLIGLFSQTWGWLQGNLKLRFQDQMNTTKFIL
ncbi:hypothetical protein M153_3770002078 [Pseudoloma neurophilia]|uniref:Uncharacterized protein n=1 Tax=Pseudoloma neurophilia TaxID=146866 RepID=A0A0R0M501_9MICR|nr:hypothetical protein M153_3770002078 [Pseudoloma neurophilia]